MSASHPTSELQSYTCLWRTVTDFQPESTGQITVKAKNMAHAIDVAKQKIYEQHNLGTKFVVVYEIEEPFL